MPYTVARASSADSHEIALLLRASIIELCGLDHGDNPDRYKAWLKNKTAANVESWIDGPGAAFVVQDQEKRILGFAMGTPKGHIPLMHVLPDARLTGVSKTLMRALEDTFRDRGLDEAHLSSTLTAERFYKSVGYAETGETKTQLDMTFRCFKKGL
ncbi:GNAT family N-acetyltransferase [Labrenzia sp. R4_1]|uniref:GNAT family N-acetyltransferase n=1 Tax=Labrenzia sp. R4_1 TaxID=2821106 RepID=UPI001ADC4E4A|nr:GNAT family N-acetyltransferase [Labrenzia sp. R4_1]MBO9426560.1 GNAT family N-acetyltransferase [Labrenzia sp. R4_1]